MRPIQLFIVSSVVAAACGDDGGPASLLPANYETTFTEVRNCRRSGDHDFMFIRILADAAAAGPYMMRQGPIPDGAMLVKEQYDASDMTCSGPILQWTLMQRLPAGTDPAALDYKWQTVHANGIVDEDTGRCVTCHADCGVPPDGFESTCALP